MRWGGGGSCAGVSVLNPPIHHLSALHFQFNKVMPAILKISIITLPLQHEGQPYCNHPCYSAKFGPGGIEILLVLLIIFF